jgi:hypothetical protein
MDATRNVASPSLALLSLTLSRHDDGNDDEQRRRKSGCSKNVKTRRRRASQNCRRPGFYWPFITFLSYVSSLYWIIFARSFSSVICVTKFIVTCARWLVATCHGWKTFPKFSGTIRP